MDHCDFFEFLKFIPDLLFTRKKAREFPGFNSISHLFLGFPVLSQDFPGFSMLSRVFPCYPGISNSPGISHAFPGFSMLSLDFPCFPGISHAFPGFFMLSHALYGRIYNDNYTLLFHHNFCWLNFASVVCDYFCAHRKIRRQA